MNTKTQLNNVTLQTLHQGDSGLAVEILQRLLTFQVSSGITSNRLKVDGNFGEMTASFVKNFQKSRNLSQDAIVGAKTWQALSELADGQGL